MLHCLLVFSGKVATVPFMSKYDTIRPYHDHEVSTVVERVVAHPDLPLAAAKLLMPNWLQGTRLGGWLAKTVIAREAKKLNTVTDIQLLIARHLRKLIDETITELSVSGLADLDPQYRYLFISNHRDIVMDSSLINFLLHQAGHQTSRMAVGDNLLANSLAADLMRLNKSFVIQRSVTGVKEMLRALTLTSNYIKDSILTDEVSIWIAQREGRAKQGWDRTEPALLKMLGLAHKDTENSINGLFERCRIVPVSVSYELDPCALMKAHEVYMQDEFGHYEKAPDEDVRSIVTGMTGIKGRVHIHFGERIAGEFSSADEAALALDKGILSGMRIFPTNKVASERLLTLEGTEELPQETNGTERAAEQVVELAEVMQAFERQLRDCPAVEQAYVLHQYANVVRNRSDLGV